MSEYELDEKDIIKNLYRVTYSVAALYGPNDPKVKSLLDVLTQIDAHAGELCGDDIAIDIIGG